MASTDVSFPEGECESGSTTGRDAQLAVLMAAKWHDEIEQAIDRIKSQSIEANSTAGFKSSGTGVKRCD